MVDLVEIAQSWIIAANPTAEQKAIADYRISVCNGCEHKKYVSSFDTYLCSLCNCPLSKKIFTPKQGDKACLANKWLK